MALSPQSNRAFKLLTAVATAGTAFHCVFRTDYGDQPHVFTGVQAWYNRTVDRMVGIDDDAIRLAREEERLRQQREKREREDALRDRVDGMTRRLADKLDDRPGGRGRRVGSTGSGSLTEEVVARER